MMDEMAKGKRESWRKLRMSKRTQWIQRFIPDGVAFVRDDQFRVCALEWVKGDKHVRMSLGTALLRSQVHGPKGRTVEWDVYSQCHENVFEAKVAYALIQYSIAALKALQTKLVEARKNKITNARRKELQEEEINNFGFVAISFLLVDEMSHPDLAQLFHQTVIDKVRALPDLDGRLNLPEGAGWK